MKKLLTILVLIPFIAWSTNPFLAVVAKKKAGGGPTTIFLETFEASEYDNAATEDNTDGTVNGDDTSFAVAAGSSTNLRMERTGGTVSVWWALDDQTQTVVTATFPMKLANYSANYSTVILEGASGVDVAFLSVRTDGQLRFYASGGSAFCEPTDATTANTEVWVQMKLDTNGEMSIEWNTSNSFTGSGTKYATTTYDGTASIALERLSIEQGNATSNTAYYDDILITTP